MKKTFAIIIELIPIVSVVFAYLNIFTDMEFASGKIVSGAAVILAFLGFVFFLVGRRLARDDKAVRILGILDLLATAAIVGLYALAFIAIGR